MAGGEAAWLAMNGWGAVDAQEHGPASRLRAGSGPVEPGPSKPEGAASERADSIPIRKLEARVVVPLETMLASGDRKLAAQSVGEYMVAEYERISTEFARYWATGLLAGKFPPRPYVKPATRDLGMLAVIDYLEGRG